jgi:hypothetical protein
MICSILLAVVSYINDGANRSGSDKCVAIPMDELTAAAARALAAGDALGALNRVALRDDPTALALRGIALAQLGDLDRARTLIRRAARAFGAHDPVARARCVVAEIDIALAARNLGWSAKRLAAARDMLEAHGEHQNAVHAHYLQIRRLLLIGRVDDAERGLAESGSEPTSAATAAIRELITAGIAIRRVQATNARAALTRASRAAEQAAIPALTAEVGSAASILNAPVARSGSGGAQRELLLDDLERLQQSDSVIVDACRDLVRNHTTIIPLTPILVTLARVLGDAWPADAPREQLIKRAFGGRIADDSHRARLRVEIGRLRSALEPVATVSATARGYLLNAHAATDVVVLAPLDDDAHTAVHALLADGQSWSSSALALALGVSQRTVQRSLDALASRDAVQSFGHGRARRWITPPVPGFAAILLLPTDASG